MLSAVTGGGWEAGVPRRALWGRGGEGGGVDQHRLLHWSPALPPAVGPGTSHSAFGGFNFLTHSVAGGVRRGGGQ